MVSTGGSIWSRRRSITSTATWDQDRYASATAHITSCNSTSTANFSTPLISTTSTGRRSHTTCGPLCENWHRKDEGVWEVRGGQREFVYSKLMCWVALDRAIRLADKRSFPAPRDRWLKIRDEIYEDIVSKGWNEKRQAFVQHYGSESLDAANLMMALTFFMSPTDPRMLATLDATLLPLEKGGLTANSLVYRYNIKEAGDGLSGEEGTFNICTF